MAAARSEWRDLGFFVLRTPLLPFDELERPFDPAVVDRPEVAEALFLASPRLEEAARRWRAGAPEPDEAGRVERTVRAYLTRMAARPTPFGLFAACATGVIGDATALTVGEVRRRTRPDMHFLAALTDRLEDDHDVRPCLTYRPNSSLYRLGGRIRLVEGRRHEGLRTFHLVAFEEDEALQLVLERAAGGATPADLAASLAAALDVTADEAAGYLFELIEAQVLVSDLAPAVTGPEPLNGLLASVSTLSGTDPAVKRLDETRSALATLDAHGPGRPPAVYRGIAAELTELVPDLDLAHLFQVDCFRPEPAPQLGRAVVAEAARAVEVLHRLTPEPEADTLDRFREAFLDRYEGREVPLVEALDEECGVGFDVADHPAADESPLLAGLDLGELRQERRRWTTRHDVLLRLLTEALRHGRDEITLDTADLDDLSAGDPPPLPPTVSVMASLAAAAGGIDGGGDFRLVVHYVTGASGAQLLGRFCHGDPRLEDGVRRLLRADEAARPDAVFAELVHLPEGRVGNILCRPVLRQHEIVYLGRSGAPPDRQLPVTDLLVSVADGRVVLRSRRLAREVIPRLTTAHDTHHRGLGIYRFLAALQAQGVADMLFWDWGPLASAPFLPRVRTGRLVLSRARWRLTGADLRPLAAAGPARWEAVQRLQDELRLPRHVAIANGDNEFVVDLDDPAAVDAAFHAAVGRTELSLVEMLPAPAELCAHNDSGRFVHELILPLARPPQAVTPPAPPACRLARAGIVRSFPPGSEWLYAKVYTGTATADGVLRHALAPVVRQALASDAADSWFFLRHADPAPHLRLRLHGNSARLRAQVEPALHAALRPLMADGQVWRLTLDTYEREVERYGGAAGMALCEAAFAADSEAVLSIVEHLSGDEGLDARWRLCLAGIHRLLDDFGFSPAERRAWARDRRHAYGQEIGGPPELPRLLGRRSRAERSALETLLAWDDDDTHPLAAGLRTLQRRSIALAPVAAELRQRDRRGLLTVPLADLVASLAHMHAIRLLRSAVRPQELVLYDLLDRLYLTVLARKGEG